MGKKQKEIVIYKPKGKAPEIKVQISKDTVWLTQAQMVELFQKTKQNISLHINNIFRESELDNDSVVKEYLTTAIDGKRYNVKYYNLDVIISVGYRVKSKRGTQFRIWATNVLRNHLIKGFTINKKRLKQAQQNLVELSDTVKLIQDIADTKKLTQDETQGLLQVISEFTYGLQILDDFDHQQLKVKGSRKKLRFKLDIKSAHISIRTMKEQMLKDKKDIGLFGLEKDDSLDGSLQNIYQTIDGKDAYPTIEEKAANLLYFIVKNHPFVDGNKRIAATLFLWFLSLNNCLTNNDGTRRLADNTLVALTLMVATSKTEDKEIMIKVIVNLINSK